MEWIASVVSAAGTIIAAWFAYNQYTKNKMTDVKIERYRQEEDVKNKRRNDSSAIVFGELWNVLYSLRPLSSPILYKNQNKKSACGVQALQVSVPSRRLELRAQ